MATTETQICNLALRRIGVNKSIEGMNEQSASGKACNDLYPHHRDTLLAAFPWPFAAKRAVLALQDESRDEWEYVYALPNECVTVREIWSGTRNPTQRGRVKWELALDDTGRARRLLTDAEDAVITYTKLVTDVALFSASFTDALVWALAADLALALAVKEEMFDRATAMARVTLERAKAQAVNEAVPDDAPESDWLTVRG